MIINIYLFQNVTDEDSMVVQHILAVRKGTREATNLNKDDTNSPSDSEGEIKKEIEEVQNDEKSDEKLDEKSEKMSEDLNEEKSVVKPDETETTLQTEHDESEKNDKTEQNADANENEVSFKKTIEVDEYYVKYRNFSYLHCEWKTEEELLKGDKRIAAKLKRFKQKMANNTNIFENVSHSVNNEKKLLLIYNNCFFILARRRTFQSGLH